MGPEPITSTLFGLTEISAFLSAVLYGHGPIQESRIRAYGCYTGLGLLAIRLFRLVGYTVGSTPGRSISPRECREFNN